MHRCFALVSDLSKFHIEIETLKNLLLKNGYPLNFIDKCVFKFLNKKFSRTPDVQTVPKKELNIVLPYLGNNSLILKTNLIKTLGKNLRFCKVKVVFKTASTLRSYFRFKDVIPENLRSCQIYNFKCGSCNASYIGKTFRHMKVRISVHQGVSPRTGKNIKGTLSTSVRDHMLFCDHVISYDNFSILGCESNHYLLELKESLFIKRDRPSLNKNIFSQELFLY